MAEERAPAPAVPRPRRRWRLLGSLLGLLLVLVAAVGGVAWLTASESGNRVLVAGLNRFGGERLQLEGWRGCLCERWQLGRLRLRGATFQLDAEGVDIAWRPAALWRRHLHIDSLQVGALALHTASGPAAAPQLPTSLALPLDITVEQIRLGVLTLGSLQAGAAPSEPDFVARRIDGRFLADADLLRVDALSAALPGLDVQATGQIATLPPFALRAEGTAQSRLGARSAQVRVQADGELAQPQVHLQLGGEGLEGAATAQLRPFAAMPLHRLDLAVKGLDPSLFHPTAPRARLDAEARLQPQEGAAVATDPRDWRFGGFVNLRNQRPEPFDRGGLPVQELSAQLAGSARSLQAEQLRLRMGGGELLGRAAWRAQAGDPLGLIDSELRLRGVALEQVVAAARPLRLAGRLSARASAGEQQFGANLRGELMRSRLPPLVLELDGRQRDGVLSLSRLEGAWASAQLSAKGELALRGRRDFRLEGRLAHFDPQAFSAQAPRGDINLQGRASGALAPPWRSELQLELLPSRLAGTPLHGRVQLAASAQRIERVDADVDLLGNRLQAQGALGRPEDRLRFVLEATRLDALWPELGGSLQANGVLGGSPQAPWGELEASVKGLHGGSAWSLAAAQIRATLQPGATGAFQVRADTGRLVTGGRQASARSQLRIDGTRARHVVQLDAALFEHEQLRLGMEGGFADGRWLGRLTDLAGEGPANFRLAAPATLELGPQRVALGPARVDSENGRIELAETWWSPQEIVARGRMEGIQVGLSVDEFQRTVMRGRSLTLGGDWDLRLGQTANGLVRIYREAGDLVLQGDTPLALGLANLDFNAAAQDGRLAFSANISGERIGVISGVLTAAAERVGSGVRLVPDAPLVGNATIDVPSIAWLGPVVDQNLRVGGSLRGELVLSGTPADPVSEGRLLGRALEVALADEGLRLSDGTLRLSSNAGRLVLDQLEFQSRRSLEPPEQRALPPDPARLGRLTGRGVFDIASGEGELRLQAERVAVLQTPRQWLLVSGPAVLNVKRDALRLDAQLESDGAFFGGAGRRTAPTLSEDVVVRGRQAPPASRLRVDARIRFDMGERFYLKAYGIDSRLEGQLDLTQEEGRWRLRGTIDTAGGQYAAYGQRLSIERGTVTFAGPLDNPALNVVALRKGLAVEAGVEVSGTARAPRVRLVSEPIVPEAEKLSWLLLGRASEAGGQDTGLLLTAASAALGGEGESMLDKLVEDVGLDQVSVGQGGGDVMRQRSSRVANSAVGTPSSAAGASTPQDQVLTVGKRLTSRAYLSLEQNLSGTESVVKLSLALNRFLALIARAGTDNALDLQYSISFR